MFCCGVLLFRTDVKATCGDVTVSSLDFDRSSCVSVCKFKDVREQMDAVE